MHDVLRRATKLVTGMKELSYNDRLKQLGLQQLEGRRIRNDLIQNFKIVNRKYDINPELFFQLDDFTPTYSFCSYPPFMALNGL